MDCVFPFSNENTIADLSAADAAGLLEPFLPLHDMVAEALQVLQTEPGRRQWSRTAAEQRVMDRLALPGRPAVTRTSVGRVPDSAVLDTGAGPAVLLLHGTAPGTTAAANFSPLVAALGGYRLLAPDLLGFGASPMPLDLEYGPELWSRQAWQILDDRGVERAAVIGNSMGARVALTMALARPHRIRGLILLSTRMTATSSPAQALLRAYTPSLEGMEQLLRQCFVTDQALVTPEVVRQRYDASAQPGAHEAMQRVFAGLATAGPGPAPDELAGITAPVMLLHGRDDRIVPSGDGSRLAALLPHADLHVLGGTGHWLQIERAGTVNALITDFLVRCPA